MNNKKKLKYEKPIISIVVIEAQDIITTSGGFAGEEEPMLDEEIL